MIVNGKPLPNAAISGGVLDFPIWIAVPDDAAHHGGAVVLWFHGDVEPVRLEESALNAVEHGRCRVLRDTGHLDRSEIGCAKAYAGKASAAPASVRNEPRECTDTGFPI